MNRQEFPEMNTSHNDGCFLPAQEDVFVVDYYDGLSTIDEENSNDISDSERSIQSRELHGDCVETVDEIDARNCLENKPQKGSTGGNGSDGLDHEAYWKKTAVSSGSSSSLRSLSSRATLSTASLSRSSSSSLSSSSLSSSRHCHGLHETPQPNEVFTYTPKTEHQWIGANIEIFDEDKHQFESIDSLDSMLVGSEAVDSSNTENEDHIQYEESYDEFVVEPDWFKGQILRRQLEARIQKIEQTIVKLRLADSKPNKGCVH